MTVNEIIDSIKAKFNGDPEHDIKEIIIAMEDIKKDPQKDQIFDVLKEMINELISQCDKKTINRVTELLSRKATMSFDAKLNTLKKYVDNGDYEEALSYANELEQVILNIINKHSKEHNEDVTCRYFFSPMEFDLYEKFFPTSNAMVIPDDYISLLSLKSQALFFLKKEKEAIEELRKAFSLDPVSVDLCFLMAEMYKETMNYISYKTYVDKAEEYCYKASDFIKYLKYLIVYYNDYEHDTETCKDLKLVIKNSNNTFKGLLAPHIKNNDKLNAHKAALLRLQDKGIKITPEKSVLAVAYNQLRICVYNNDVEGINYYKAVLNDFFDKAAIDKVMASIPDKEEKKIRKPRKKESKNI